MLSSRTTLRQVLDAIDAGHPQRAKAGLKGLTADYASASEQGLSWAASAELWLAAGENDRAIDAANRALTKTAGAEAAARAKAVQAIALADSGSVHLARAAAQEAVSHASRSEFASLNAWVVLRRLSILISRGNGEELEAEFEAAHHTAYRSGQSSPVALFHTLRASWEGRAGRLDQARKCLGVARELLLHTPHPVVSTIWAVTAMIVASLDDDYDAAIHLGKEALDSALRCGYLRLVPRIRGNLALAYLKQGSVAKSKEQFDLRGPSDQSRLSQIGLLDSLAQLHLMSSDYRRCHELLESVEALLDSDAIHGWYWFSFQETRLEYLLATGNVRSQIVARDARSAADEARHLNFSALFSLFEARSLCASGDAVSALRTIQSAKALTSWSLSLSTVGRRELVLADIARLQSDRSRARLHLDRAQRILSRVGSSLVRSQLVSAEHRFTETISPAGGDCPLDFSSAGFIVECAQNAEVLAAELLAQLARIHPVARAVFSDDSDPSVRGRPIVTLEDTKDRPADYVVCLGQKDGGNCNLLIWTVGTPEDNRFGLAIRMAEAAAWQKLARVSQPELPAANKLVNRMSNAVFEAPSAKKALSLVDQIAPTVLPVILLGETGSGKEVLARRLHERSARSDGPFVPFNCASVSPELLDSHLFGHVRGAFTSAVSDFIGIVRSADKGTLFLDEIAEMPIAAQPKLLRFLESGEVRPVGSVRSVSVDVRIVAATNRNIVEMVKQGTFREDLYYRLNGLAVHVPPLRERREDIPILANLFIARNAALLGKPAPRLSTGAVEVLMLRRWAGNVRELSNEMRRLVALVDHEGELTAQVLGSVLSSEMEPAPSPNNELTPMQGIRLEDAVEGLERRMIADALGRCDGRVAEAAALLGLSRKGLFLKRRRLSI